MSRARSLLLLLLAITVANAFEFDLMNVDVTTLGNLPNSYTPETKPHSIFKRDLLKAYLGNHVIPSALKRYGPMSDWTMLECFAGAGIHHPSPPANAHDAREKGSPLAIIEAGVKKNPDNIPHYYFIDGNANVLTHLQNSITAVAPQLAAKVNGKHPGGAGAKITPFNLMTNHVAFGTAQFFEQAFPKTVGKGKVLNNRHLWTHVDPYFYYHAPFDAVKVFFTKAPAGAGKQRVLNMNVFTAKMFDDLIAALTPVIGHGGKFTVKPATLEAQVNRQVHVHGFGYGKTSAANFLTDLYNRAAIVYPPAPHHVVDAAYGSAGEEIINEDLHAAQAGNDYALANRVSKVLADLWFVRMGAIVPNLHVANNRVALVENGKIMYWMSVISTAKEPASEWDRLVRPNIFKGIRATVAHHSSYFQNPDPVGGAPNNFIELQQQQRFTRSIAHPHTRASRGASAAAAAHPNPRQVLRAEANQGFYYVHA